MKKIIEIIPEFKLAGAETMCENLISSIDKTKYDVIAISLYSNKTAITNRLESQGIKIYYLDKKKGIDLKIFFKLCKILKNEKPNMVHTHLYVLRYSLIPSLLFARKAKKIHTVHNIAEKEISNGKFIHKIAFKIFKVVPVAISEIVRESIVKVYKMDLNKIPLVYNGIDLNRCIKKNNYKKTNKIIHIGRFSEQKNHKELVDIFAKCLFFDSSLKLILIGDGENKDQILNYCKEKQILENIEFLGLQDECYKYLTDADMFVMPSKWEGMPITIIEALGTGLPIVAYPVGGIPDMIEENINGFLPENADEFVKDIIKLEKNDKMREKIGRNNANYSSTFSSKTMADAYCNLLIE